MRIIVISCVYPPEPVVSSRTSADIASALAARGDEVTVIAPFPSRPGGVLHPGFRRRFLSRQRGNPRLLRCFATVSRSSSLVSRLAENVSFGITSAVALAFAPRPDVIYSNSWPIFATALVRMVAAARRIPVVISVQDLYPESLILLGRMAPSSLFARVLRAIDGRISRGSRFVIAISNRFADVYRSSRGVDRQRLLVIPNWGEPTGVLDREASMRFRQRLGVAPDERLLVFGGNIGIAAGADRIVEAARLLGDDDRIRIMIAGGGSETERVRRMAAEVPNGRVIVHSPWPKEETSVLLGAADAFLLPTFGDQSMGSVPSKLISYFQSGRPVLAVALADSDLADTMRQAEAGWVVPPNEPGQFAAVLREISRMSAEALDEIGRAGQHYAQKNFSREECLPRVLDALDRAAASMR
jgi:glycosyltransferase involved in cell wall biosynthesis